MLLSHHVCHNRKVAAGLQLVPAAWKLGAVTLPGQAWGRISGGVLSLFSSHLRAWIFRILKIALLLCCLWQWVWLCLLLALTFGDSAHGGWGGASSLRILFQPLCCSPCVLWGMDWARSKVPSLLLYLWLGTFSAHISCRQWPAVKSWHCLGWADKRRSWECSACQRCWVLF